MWMSDPIPVTTRIITEDSAVEIERRADLQIARRDPGVRRLRATPCPACSIE